MMAYLDTGGTVIPVVVPSPPSTGHIFYVLKHEWAAPGKFVVREVGWEISQEAIATAEPAKLVVKVNRVDR